MSDYRMYLACKLIGYSGENVSVEVRSFDTRVRSPKTHVEVIHTAARFFANVGGRDCIEVVPDMALRGWVVTMPSMEGGRARGAGWPLPVPSSDLIQAAYT
jgi:hypothetical protein